MKELGGLRLKPTLERLITDGRTYDFDNLMIKSRGALDYQKSFFKPPDLDPTDEGHDAKHEQVLASMAGLVQEMEAQRARKQNRSRRMYAEEQENVPPANMHEHAATIGPLGEAGANESWRERQARRQAQFKPQSAPYGNAERQDARRKAERGRDMEHRRQKPEVHNMARDDSPQLAPRQELQSKYDKRLMASRKTPLLSRASSARGVLERSTATRAGEGDARMQLRRESLAQQNNKRARQQDVPTRLRRRRQEDPLPGRRRGDVGPIATTPRGAY
jgi:hypothetical protein